MPFREEMRVEELLQHRGRGAVPPPRRHRIENHRNVEVALMIRREDHGPLQIPQMLESRDGDARVDAAERQDPRWKTRAADDADRPRAIPPRKSDHRSVWRLEVGCWRLDF